MALLLLGLSAAAQQAPPPQGSVAISGTIVHAVTGAPVPNAKVTLSGSEPMDPRLPLPPTSFGSVDLVTDQAGRFHGQNLRPGRYTFQVTAEGFIERNHRSQQAVTLAAGEAKTGITLQLLPHSVITGRIFDQDGNPVAGVTVTNIPVHRATRRAVAGFSQYARSNHLGEYRLAGLAPGFHLLIADGPARPGLVQRRTYFPSHTDPTSATLIEVAPDGELRGHDIRLRTGEAFEIKGRLEHRGPAATQSNVALLPVSSPQGIPSLSDPKYTSPGPDGTFTFSGVLPGDYVVSAFVAAGQGLDRAVFLTSRRPLKVTNASLDGITLQTQPMAQFSGRFVRQNDPADTIGFISMEGMMVTFRNTAKHGADSRGTGTADQEGNFKLSLVSSGIYRPQFHGSGWNAFYIQSLTQGGREVLTEGLDASQPGELLIQLASDGGQIRGTVSPPAHKPLYPIDVILWPDGEHRGHAHRISSDGITDNPAFQITAIPPGRYLLAAVMTRQGDSILDPDFLKLLEPRAERIEVGAGSKQVKDLKLIDLALE